MAAQRKRQRGNGARRPGRARQGLKAVAPTLPGRRGGERRHQPGSQPGSWSADSEPQRQQEAGRARAGSPSARPNRAAGHDTGSARGSQANSAAGLAGGWSAHNPATAGLPVVHVSQTATPPLFVRGGEGSRGIQGRCRPRWAGQRHAALLQWRKRCGAIISRHGQIGQGYCQICLMAGQLVQRAGR